MGTSWLGNLFYYRSEGSNSIRIIFFLLVIIINFLPTFSWSWDLPLSEYAKRSLDHLVRTCIEILSSLLSVVGGLFGYLVFVVQFKYGFSIISGALAWPSLTCHRWPAISKMFAARPPYTAKQVWKTGLVSLGNCDSCCGTRALPSNITLGRFSLRTDLGEAAALIYRTQPLIGQPISLVWPVQFHLSPSLKLAVHIWRSTVRRNYPRLDRSSSADPAAVLWSLSWSLTLEHVNSEVTIKTNICLKEKERSKYTGMRDTSHFPEEKVVLSIKDLHVYYGTNESIKVPTWEVEKNKITALTVLQDLGKSTYLRLNRTNDTIDIARVTGKFGMKESMLIVQISRFMNASNIDGFNGPTLPIDL